jgi:hypothetical protein
VRAAACRRALPLASVLLAAGLGCQALNTPLYFNGNMPLVTTGMPVNGMQERIKDALSLRFRRPHADEQKDLDARRAAAAPVKVPWIARDNVHVEVLFTVKNLETPLAPGDAGAGGNVRDPNGVFNVSVDGANEFLKYDEDVTSAAISAANQPAVFIPLMQSRPQMLAAGETFSGMLREDDFAEAESDLNAMDQFMAPFAAVLINRSEVNPVGLEMVPPGVVVPAMIEVDVTFTADRNMSCTYLVRVRDDHDLLLHDSGDSLFQVTPAVFQPPPPPMTP